jgi:hypothetical protein
MSIYPSPPNFVAPSAPTELNEQIVRDIVIDELNKRLPIPQEKSTVKIPFHVGIDQQILNLPSGSFGLINILENNLNYTLSIHKINTNFETHFTETLMNFNSLYKYLKKTTIKNKRVGFLVKEYFSIKHNQNIKKIQLFENIQSQKIFSSMNTIMTIPAFIIQHNGKKYQYTRLKNGLYIQYEPINRKIIKKIL